MTVDLVKCVPHDNRELAAFVQETREILMSRFHVHTLLLAMEAPRQDLAPAVDAKGECVEYLTLIVGQQDRVMRSIEGLCKRVLLQAMEKEGVPE